MFKNKILGLVAIAITPMAMILSGCSSTTDDAQGEKAELVYPPAPAPPRFYFERMILSNLDVEYETEDDKIQRFLTGSGKVGKGLSKPFDMAVHQGRIFVSDPGNRVVHIFDPQEHFYGQVESKDDYSIVKPFGLDVDDAGNLYVLDRTARDIKIYNRDGDFLRRLKPADKDLYSMPSGLAVKKDGSRIYVSDTGGVSSDKHHILVFDTSSGELLRTIGKRGKGDVEFNLPKDIEVDDNLLYVVDSGNFRVQVIDLKTDELSMALGRIGRKSGNFSRPKGIAIDKAKNIYVSDAAFGNFQIFNPEGQLLLFIGERSNILSPAKYMLNAGIAVDEDGRVLITDQYHRKVDIFRPVTIAENAGYLAVLPPLSDEEYKAKKAKKSLKNKAKEALKDKQSVE